MVLYENMLFGTTIIWLVYLALLLFGWYFEGCVLHCNFDCIVLRPACFETIDPGTREQYLKLRIIAECEAVPVALAASLWDLSYEQAMGN